MVNRVQKFIFGLLAIILMIGVVSNIINPFSVFTIFGSFLLIWLGYSLKTRIDSWSKRQVNIYVLSALLLMLIGQLLVLKYLPMTVYHDPFRVYTQAEYLTRHSGSWGLTTYFWRYPNNATLAIILSWFIKLGHMVGLTTTGVLHGLSLVSYDGLVVSLLIMAKKWSARRSHQVFLVTFLAVLPLSYSYFIQVFYSDTPVILCLAWIMFIVLQWPTFSTNGRRIAGAILPFLVLIGQIIKPNLIVFLIAVILYASWIFWTQRVQFKQIVLIPLILVVVGFGLAGPVKQVILNSQDYQANERYELPPTSWIYMGLNQKHNGAYAGSDVHAVLKLADKEARNDYFNSAIPTRLKTYTPFSYLAHVVGKIGILLSSAKLPQAYVGGHVNAPKWYQEHQAVIYYGEAVLQQTLWLTLYLVVLGRGISSFKNTWDGNKVRIRQSMLAALVILGYSAFHGLIWETEARYGLILIPVLIMLLWISEAPTSEWRSELFSSGKLNGRSITPLALVGIGLIGLSIGIQGFEQKKVVTVAQRSQLSEQYGALVKEMPAHTTLKQKVPVKTEITDLTVQIPSDSQVEGEMINLKNQEHHRLVKLDKNNGSFLVNTEALAAGDYQILLKNLTSEGQPVWIVELPDYKLAPDAIRGTKDTSLIYTFYDQQPVFIF
ncbi:hypothetical protein ACJQWY_05445 [Weissella kandleri]|uniref:hypothetical protein n=1 Tax=Weissella kandleri TaxID=1616 RepID=UPI00387E321D